MSDEVSWRAARHEAGHILAAIVLGYEVRGARAYKGDAYTDIPALDGHMPASHRAMIALAGDTAVALLDRYGRGAVGPVDVVRDLSGSDRTQLDRALKAKSGQREVTWALDTWEMLKGVKGPLDRLARRLYDAGEMTGLSINDFLGLSPSLRSSGRKGGRISKAPRRTYRTSKELRTWATELRSSGRERLAEFIQHRAAVLDGREPARIERTTFGQVFVGEVQNEA